MWKMPMISEQKQEKKILSLVMTAEKDMLFHPNVYWPMHYVASPELAYLWTKSGKEEQQWKYH